MPHHSASNWLNMLNRHISQSPGYLFATLLGPRLDGYIVEETISDLHETGTVQHYFSEDSIKELFEPLYSPF